MDAADDLPDLSDVETVEALMAYMQERVHAAYDMVLEPEVRLVGERA